MNIADYEAAGLYDAKAAGAAQRLELLEWLVAHGATLEQMVRAHRDGLLRSLAGDLALRPGRRYTADEVAARTNLPVERLRQMTLAAGVPSLGARDNAGHFARDLRRWGRFRG